MVQPRRAATRETTTVGHQMIGVRAWFHTVLIAGTISLVACAPDAGFANRQANAQEQSTDALLVELCKQEGETAFNDATTRDAGQTSDQMAQHILTTCPQCSEQGVVEDRVQRIFTHPGWSPEYFRTETVRDCLQKMHLPQYYQSSE